MAAGVASSERVPAELLLGMTEVESGGNPCVVSYVRNGVRTRRYSCGERMPAGFSRSTFCGLTQAKAHGWRDCLALRSPLLVYRRTVSELEAWLDFSWCRRSRNRMRCALLGYGGGLAAIERNDVNRYPERVFSRAKIIAKPK